MNTQSNLSKSASTIALIGASFLASCAGSSPQNNSVEPIGDTPESSMMMDDTCSDCEAGTCTTCDGGHGEMMPDMPKISEAHFSKEKAYEFAFFTIADGSRDRIFNDYLPKAGPYIKKYGGRAVGMFQVVQTESKLLTPTMAAIFEWPNPEAKAALEADLGFQKVALLREGGFSFFKSGWFKPSADTDVSFRSDKFYELGGASLFRNETAKATLDQYFEVSGPIKNSYGGTAPKFLAMFAPEKAESSYTNDMQFIVEWDSLEDKDKLFANKAFNDKALPLLHAAIESMDIVIGKFIFKDN